MRTRWTFYKTVFLLALILGTAPSYAASSGPQAVSLSGELFLPDGSSVVSPSVNFLVQVWDAAETCVLYSETHLAMNLKTSSGRFNLVLGTGSAIVNNVGTPGTLDARVFSNTGITPVAHCSQPTVALNAGDQRQIRISYDLGGGYVALAPDVPMVASAYAMIADTLQGKSANDFLQVNDSGSTALNQANTEYTYSATNWPRLKALLDGNSSQYLATTPTAPLDLNGQRITDLQDPTGLQDAATKHYVDTTVAGSPVDLSSVGPMTGNNNVLRWDATANKWVASALNTSPTGAAGGDLSGTYPNPTIANDTINAAKISSTGGGPSRLLITDASGGTNIKFGECTAINQVYAWTALGWACTNVSALAPVTSVAGRGGDVVLSAGDINGIHSAALYDWGTAAGQIPRLDASARLPAVDGSLLSNVNAVQLQGRSVAATLPTTGQVLGWNGSAWTPLVASSGSVTTVASGAGLLGGPITSTGTLSVDVGTTASKIMQLDSSARIPAVDASQLYNVNASKIGTRAIASTNPGAGQVLGWNVTTTQWEPTAGNANSVTNIATGNGVLGGPITSTGTLSIDAGTAANKILQLNPSAMIPAVDGSLLFNVNATKVGTRTVASTNPGVGQVLGWNVSTTQWEPVFAATGSVTSVSSGVGLTGGPITSTGTLNVDVGTSANKIMQLDPSAKIPAVDASQLYNVNASKIGTRAIASTNPVAGQVLGWNTTTTQWEPSAGNANSVTNITTGNGVLGGPITSTGSISIDAGTTANKILQLNPSALIPAVDGSLLYNVNATKLATRTVSSATPGAGQVLGFNLTTTQWEPTTASTGSVTSVNSGTGLTGGPITTNGTLNVDVGTAANKILQLNSSAQIPAVDGSLVYNVNASKIATRTVSSATPVAGQVLGFNATTTQWEPSAGNANSVTNIATGNGILGGPITSTGSISVDAGTAANKILQLNSSAMIPAVDGSLLYNVNASKIATRTVSASNPVAGQVLGWNTTSTQWEPTSAATGSVTNVASGVGLTGGPISSIGTLNVDVGTSANKIMQLDPSAKIPAVDASQIYNVNASKIGTRTVATTNPTLGQVLGWNATTTQWEPSAGNANSVTNIATGNGVLGGPITSTGTISIDAGTTANKILQLNPSALIPAVDGSLLYNVNATKLATRAVSSTAPGAGQVLGFNLTTTQWEPVSAFTGSVTAVNSGTGMTGGPITTNGTLNVDVGTAANKILQLNSGAQVPAVDASLLYNVNASKIATRTVSSAMPVAGQVLGFNVTTTQWEPTAGNANSVTNIATGNGVLGGPITSTGTISIDAGTAANKILQLNPTAMIPAVDASLLYNVNASKIATRTVSSATPLANQVLGFNITTTQWEPVSASTGSVTNVASGVGLTGGPIVSTGTLNVDVGSAASKIVQENSNAQIAQTNGTVALPSYTFAANSSTGLYSPGAGQLALTSNGTAVFNVAANGRIGMGTASPSGSLSVVKTDLASTDGIESFYTPALTGSSSANLIATFSRVQLATSSDTGGYIWGSVNRAQTSASTTGITNYLAGALNDVQNASGRTVDTLVGTESDVVSSGAGTVAEADGLYASVKSSGTTAMTTAYGVRASVATSGSGTIATGYGVYIGNMSATTKYSFYASDPNATSYLAAPLGIGTNAPAAGLDVALTGSSSAIIVPRDSTLNRPSTPVNGMLRYNNTLNVMEGYINNTWSALSSGSSAGTLTNVATGNGVLGGPITSTGTISIDAGTAANKILQLNASALIPAVDGSLLYNVNATKIATRTVSSASPSANQVLGWNALSTQWEPQLGNANSVTNIATSTGLLGGPITTTGTLSVDVGTTANKILQLNSNAQVAQNSGSASLPAYSFVGNASTGLYSPSANQLALATSGTTALTVLGNGNVGIGTATPGQKLEVAGTVNAYLFLTGYGSPTGATFGNYATGMYYDATGLAFSSSSTERVRILNNGNIGFGTSAPAAGLDIAMTGTGASAIIVPRDSTLNRPSVPVNGMLRYNNTLNVMEGYINNGWSTLASGSSAGSVTNIASGTGLTGGPISTTGTLSVDVGSAAGKIVQENPNSQIAQTSGSAALPSYSFANGATTGIFSPGANQLAFATNGTAAMTILGNGSIGVGITNPTLAMMQVAGTIQSDVVLQVRDPANAVGSLASAQIKFKDKNNVDVGQIGYFNTRDMLIQNSDTNSAIRLITGGTTNLMVTPSGAVGVGTSVPQAGLDIATTGTGGSAIIVPRDTTTNRPSVPVNGMLRYNNTLNALEGYINSAWSVLATGTASAGLANFTEGVNSAAPNATVPVVRLLANNAATNVDVAFSPKGTGAITAHVADGTSTGGNKRGANAVDWQTARTDATYVASGATSVIGGGSNNSVAGVSSVIGGGVANQVGSFYSVIAGGSTNSTSGAVSTIGGGYSNNASGNYSTIVGGASNSASGFYSAVIGGNGNQAIGQYSVAANISTTAVAYAQTTLGSYNMPTGSESPYTWVATDPLLVVGNGTSTSGRSNALVILKNGAVGIGTTAPGSGTALSVEGQIRTKSGSITTGAVDWSLGNAITTTFDCGSNISFANLRDGASYTLVVTGTGTTQCSFGTTTTGDDAATVTYRFNPANGARTASSHTIYSLMRIGTIVYISWIPGF